LKAFRPEQQMVALLLAAVVIALVLWRLLAWRGAPP
jgi:hypothetical protein